MFLKHVLQARSCARALVLIKDANRWDYTDGSRTTGNAEDDARTAIRTFVVGRSSSTREEARCPRDVNSSALLPPRSPAWPRPRGGKRRRAWTVGPRAACA